MDFDKILFMHWYIWSILWLIHIIFPNFSTQLWPLIDFRITFMFNILWNIWWIWSNLVVTLIFFLCQNICNNKNKHIGVVSCSVCNTFIGFVMRWLILLFYCKKKNQTSEKNAVPLNSKNSGPPKICCDHPKSWTRWLYLRIVHPKDAEEVANRVDPDQTRIEIYFYSIDLIILALIQTRHLGN